MAGSPPFELEGLDHVVLLVGDMDVARRFYCEVVGCSIDRELPQYGMLQLRAGVSMIDLVDISGEEGTWARPPVDGGRNMDHVCLATCGFDVEELRKHLAGHGVDIGEEGIRYGATGDGYSVYFNDPFGNQIELKSAAEANLAEFLPAP
jgi:catechol 2,3-dioxygenase-like lactoylglutathione lyase family enzyme